MNQSQPSPLVDVYVKYVARYSINTELFLYVNPFFFILELGNPKWKDASETRSGTETRLWQDTATAAKAHTWIMMDGHVRAETDKPLRTVRRESSPGKRQE